MRVQRGATRADDMYVTSTTRDGGPLNPPVCLEEAIANAREDRRSYKTREP